jgi:hypothetical protein
MARLLTIFFAVVAQSVAFAEPTLQETLSGCNGPHQAAEDLKCDDLFDQVKEFRALKNANEDGAPCAENTKLFAEILNKNFRCKNLGRGENSCTAQCTKSMAKLSRGNFKHSNLYSKDQIKKLSGQMAEKSRYCSRMVAAAQAQDMASIKPPSCEITIAEKKAERLDPAPRAPASSSPPIVTQPVGEPSKAAVESPATIRPIGDEGFEPISR